MDLHTLSIRELRETYRRKEATPVDVVESLAKRICEIDPRLQSYLATDLELALADARQADLSRPLGGIPIALKDNINALGQQCTSGSKILVGYRAAYDATVSARLREAGAVLFGRTNLDEFAMGSSCENSGFYPTRNPWDLNRIPGGSSGGSAASVAADLAIAALGSDTGGSVRLPAGLCGCVGLKPSYGRVSRYGLVAYASSLDQIGPLTKTVEDAGLLLQTIAGHDPQDSTSRREPVPAYDTAEIDLKGVRIGLPKEYFVDGIDPQVSAAVQKAIAWYESMGAEMVELSLPNTEHAIGVYYIIATAEASGNLARFDGVRYGHRARGAKDLLDQYRSTREEGFGPEVKRRIILGTYVLSAGYHDAYYLKAQKIRTLIRHDFTRAFEKVDAILSPTSPFPAFEIGAKVNDPLQMYLVDIFTVGANLAGICGISLPCGFAQVDGKALPIGLQLLGKPFAEESLLRLAGAYERAHDWRRQRPPL